MRSNFQVLAIAIEYPGPTNNIAECEPLMRVNCFVVLRQMWRESDVEGETVRKASNHKCWKTVNGKLGSAKYEMNCGMCVNVFVYRYVSVAFIYHMTVANGKKSFSTTWFHLYKGMCVCVCVYRSLSLSFCHCCFSRFIPFAPTMLFNEYIVELVGDGGVFKYMVFSSPFFVFQNTLPG